MNRVHPTDLFAPINHSEGAGAYFLARREHAFLLKCEGLTYQQIAVRLGLKHKDMIGHIVHAGAEDLQWGMRKAKFRFRAEPTDEAAE